MQFTSGANRIMPESKTTPPSREKRLSRSFGAGINQDRNGNDEDPLKPTLDEIEAQLEAEGEPLSLAEEIAEDLDAGETDVVHKHYESIKQGDIHIAELQRMS